MELRYEIKWRDSGLHIEGWKNKDEIIKNKTVIVETCGYLVYYDKDNIYIALTRHKEENSYYGVQVIWKPSIVSMVRLRER